MTAPAHRGGNSLWHCHGIHYQFHGRGSTLVLARCESWQKRVLVSRAGGPIGMGTMSRCKAWTVCRAPPYLKANSGRPHCRRSLRCGLHLTINANGHPKLSLVTLCLPFRIPDSRENCLPHRMRLHGRSKMPLLRVESLRCKLFLCGRWSSDHSINPFHVSAGERCFARCQPVVLYSTLIQYCSLLPSALYLAASFASPPSLLLLPLLLPPPLFQYAVVSSSSLYWTCSMVAAVGYLW